MAGLNTTRVDFQTYKKITASDGTYSTWTDIITKARTAIPVNNEIFLVPFKSMEEVGFGDNVTWDVLETKNVEYLRTELDKNNKLTQNKFVMMLYNDFMASYEYSILDQKSVWDWAAIAAGVINQMFISKQDISNALAADEIQKIALALGNFTIVKNADGLLLDAEGNLEEKAFKTLGIQMRRLLNSYRVKRTKFAKGIDINRLKWVNSPNFSLNLLGSLTASVAGSNEAYRDLKFQNIARNFLGTEFTESMYLGSDIDMAQFTPTAGTQNGQVQNQGKFTGNLVKPFTLGKLFSISWLPESLKYYGHNFTTTDVPAANSRTTRVQSFMWRSQVAIDPVLAGFNHIFITELPTFPSYTKVDGTVVEQLDLNDFENYKKFKQNVRAEQPMLYNTLIDESGETGNGVTNSGQWTTYIANNTLNWKGANYLRNNFGFLSKKK